MDAPQCLEQLLPFLVRVLILCVPDSHADIEGGEVLNHIVQGVTCQHLEALSFDEICVIQCLPVAADELVEDFGASAEHSAFG